MNVVCEMIKNDEEVTYKSAEKIARDSGLSANFIVSIRSNGDIRWKVV